MIIIHVVNNFQYSETVFCPVYVLKYFYRKEYK